MKICCGRVPSSIVLASLLLPPISFGIHFPKGLEITPPQILPPSDLTSYLALAVPAQLPKLEPKDPQLILWSSLENLRAGEPKASADFAEKIITVLAAAGVKIPPSVPRATTLSKEAPLTLAQQMDATRATCDLIGGITALRDHPRLLSPAHPELPLALLSLAAKEAPSAAARAFAIFNLLRAAYEVSPETDVDAIATPHDLLPVVETFLGYIDRPPAGEVAAYDDAAALSIFLQGDNVDLWMRAFAFDKAPQTQADLEAQLARIGDILKKQPALIKGSEKNMLLWTKAVRPYIQSRTAIMATQSAEFKRAAQSAADCIAALEKNDKPAALKSLSPQLAAEIDKIKTLPALFGDGVRHVTLRCAHPTGTLGANLVLLLFLELRDEKESPRIQVITATMKKSGNDYIFAGMEKMEHE